MSTGRVHTGPATGGFEVRREGIIPMGSPTLRIPGRRLEVPDQLYDETEGNPFFVVEALRAGWTSRHIERGWMSPKVQAVIGSRLAQLSEPARDLAGIAATIGREFT